MAFYRTERDYKREMIKKAIRKEVKENHIAYSYAFIGLFFVIASAKTAHIIQIHRYFIGGLFFLLIAFFIRYMNKFNKLEKTIRRLKKMGILIM